MTEHHRRCLTGFSNTLLQSNPNFLKSNAGLLHIGAIVREWLNSISFEGRLGTTASQFFHETNTNFGVINFLSLLDKPLQSNFLALTEHLIC